MTTTVPEPYAEHTVSEQQESSKKLSKLGRPKSQRLRLYQRLYHDGKSSPGAKKGHEKHLASMSGVGSDLVYRGDEQGKLQDAVYHKRVYLNAV
ncbi:hypothetical protein SNK05_010759 [Fusarium graminearum]|uniref:Chromosome 3, complete genome n=1 Tax=Gibberella zeae (strain ATCC MYA-4620 / CBS 123657 / FGSC 9075 / NRRL 31084 / PH-1) TaxID=229533 RepID=A0A098DYB8_GIBZE|nr:unnamed protein product [Fusarium graminearum]CEF86835.1 unnamed protein product [Fusarium graminearum]